MSLDICRSKGPQCSWNKRTTLPLRLLNLATHESNFEKKRLSSCCLYNQYHPEHSSHAPLVAWNKTPCGNSHYLFRREVKMCDLQPVSCQLLTITWSAVDEREGQEAAMATSQDFLIVQPPLPLLLTLFLLLLLSNSCETGRVWAAAHQEERGRRGMLWTWEWSFMAHMWPHRILQREHLTPKTHFWAHFPSVTAKSLC